MPRSLIALPYEILDSILSPLSSSVDRNELRRLRLVCKTFEQSRWVTPIAFKAVRLQNFTKEAFDNLFKISQSHLSSYVEHFEYKLVELHEQTSLSSNVHAADSIIGLSAPPKLDWIHGKPATVQEWARMLMEKHQKWLLQQDIIGTFYDIISLAKTLPSFPSLRAVTISKFNEYESNSSYGTAALQAFWAVIKALNLCENTIESLHLGLFCPHMFPTFSLSHDDYQEQGIIALSKLRHMEIRELVTHESTFYRHQHLMFERIFLTECIHLETLILGHNEMWDDDFAFRLTIKVFQLILPHLRVCELRFSNAVQEDGEQIVRFLKYHKKLERLVLTGFAISEPSVPAGWEDISRWERVFSSTRGQVSIPSVELASLFWGCLGNPWTNEETKHDIAKYVEWLQEKPDVMEID
ncbi:hypothetical protein EX30DRAFT_340532 [Ascodesmis nigricans]|uniref:F-box domain-containing protein n=1 Tax=Ascodesmis nigricans TaxID=341454 RepID=A0A4S2MY96_9PEZI|nr:hypothetical protein EX30DRAFT_340532 [Ascodesmis nigricans]